MQKTIDSENRSNQTNQTDQTLKTRKKIAPIIIAILTILFMIPFLVLALMAMGFLSMECIAVTPILLGYIIFGLIIIIGIGIALKQRLREIDGGEEDEAKKY